MLFLELSRPEVTLMFAGFVTPGEMHNGAFIVKNSQGSRINSDSPLILGV